SYTYQQGPDGKMYAIGGEVSISTPAASTPEEAITNARQVMASAMAAGSPSPQDFAVASSARVMEMKAMQQLAKETAEESLGKETYASLAQDEEQKSKPFSISA
ncbi:putative metalloprotease CJM1_0395 family protein, partial [Sulfurimonas sp.]